MLLCIDKDAFNLVMKIKKNIYLSGFKTLLNHHLPVKIVLFIISIISKKKKKKLQKY